MQFEGGDADVGAGRDVVFVVVGPAGWGDDAREAAGGCH